MTILTGSISAVLLDLDGTLADSLGALRSAYCDFLSGLEICPNEQEFQDLKGPSLNEIVRTLKNRYSLVPSEETLQKRYLAIVEDKYAREVNPLPGAIELLNALMRAGYALALVSSCPAQLTQAFLDRQGWQQYFGLLVSGDQVERSKPAPDIYRLALSSLKITPNQAMALEDSPSGVKAARAAGIATIGLGGAELIEAGAIGVVADLYSAAELLTASELAV